MEMLNISCHSWGPNNSAAYIKEQGSFGAQAMVLVCSSHDAVDQMTFSPVVGVLKGYPKEQYQLAIYELFDRYLIPYFKDFTTIKPHTGSDAEVTNNATDQQEISKPLNFVSGFDELKQIADSLEIPMYIYLHAERYEMENKQFSDMGQRIILWADSAKVSLINGIQEGENIELYRDHIHFNDKGQRHLANVLKKFILYPSCH